MVDMVDFEKIFALYNISIAQSGRHKRTGYSNVVCPYCTGNSGYHLGFNQIQGSAVCFRCSGKNRFKALADVLQITLEEATKVYNEHSTHYIPSSYQGFQASVDEINVQDLNLKDLLLFHRYYLEDRHFNVDRLIHFFDLKSTGHKTDPFYLQNKIFIPYYLNGRLMTYSTRDISVDTNQSGMRSKYITCRKAESLLPPNYMIYNFDNIKNRKNLRTLFFEGSPDTWRFPTCSGGLSGIKFPPAQVKMIIDNFNYPVFLLDPDSAGDNASQKAFDEIEILSGRTPEVYELDCSLKNENGSCKDPGDFNYDEADELLNVLEIHI